MRSLLVAPVLLACICLLSDFTFSTDIEAVVQDAATKLVRDPIERQISDFHFVCRKMKNVDCDSADSMNDFFRRRLNATQLTAIEVYVQDGYHWIPIYDYVMRPNEVRQVDYIIQMDDNIAKHFNRLGTASQLPFRYPRKRKNGGRYNLTITDLHPSILRQMKERFRKVYELLWCYVATVEIRQYCSNVGHAAQCKIQMSVLGPNRL